MKMQSPFHLPTFLVGVRKRQHQRKQNKKRRLSQKQKNPKRMDSGRSNCVYPLHRIRVNCLNVGPATSQFLKVLTETISQLLLTIDT
jgi:hypothetical protein